MNRRSKVEAALEPSRLGTESSGGLRDGLIAQFVVELDTGVEEAGIFKRCFAPLADTRRADGGKWLQGDVRHSGLPDSTAVLRSREAEEEQSEQFDRLQDPVGSSVQVPAAVETLQGQGQGDDQPVDEETVGLVVTDVFHAVAVLAVVEPLVFDLPATLRHVVEGLATSF